VTSFHVVLILSLFRCDYEGIQKSHLIRVIW